MLKREWLRKATGSYRIYSSLVKLQPRFLSLQWMTCLWAEINISETNRCTDFEFCIQFSWCRIHNRKIIKLLQLIWKFENSAILSSVSLNEMKDDMKWMNKNMKWRGDWKMENVGEMKLWEPSENPQIPILPIIIIPLTTPRLELRTPVRTDQRYNGTSRIDFIQQHLWRLKLGYCYISPLEI